VPTGGFAAVKIVLAARFGTWPSPGKN